MKILIVNKFLYPNGGSETYIFRIGACLTGLGHEVQYFGMEHKGRIVGNHAESYTADMDFHTGKMQKLLYPFKIIYSVEARKKIKAVLDDFEPDIVHLNNFNFQLTPSILYELNRYKRASVKKIKIVFTAHDSQLVCPNHLMQQYVSREKCTRCIGGSPWNCTKYKCIHGSAIKSFLGSLEAWLYRKLKTYRIIDLVICPSNFIKEKLDTCSELKGKTVVMHNFIEGSLKAQEKKNAEPPYVLYFGRFSDEKGIGNLLKACEKLAHISFVFAGSGPLEGEVNRVPNILNKGFLAGQELYQLIRQAQFSVFPSECNENCPFAVMESIACGTPVIGAGIGGVPELIREGYDGLLYESGNTEQLCEKINMLWQDGKLRLKLEEGCGTASFLDVTTYCEKLIGYYCFEREEKL